MPWLEQALEGDRKPAFDIVQLLNPILNLLIDYAQRQGSIARSYHYYEGTKALPQDPRQAFNMISRAETNSMFRKYIK